jgi:lipopolysaccharide/colanic/teichoic acid biosynthesis glycosyltransferase
VKLTSPGPVFYNQVRVGLDRRRYRSLMPLDRRQQNLCGRIFTMHKFRTMRVDAESRTGPVWARRDDPRVTPIGAFLRACRLDELPQLYNVLKGDMNIVGPRPERPTIVVDLVNAITDYPIRQRTLPGITGLAQISQSPDGTIDDVRVKVRYDLEYLRRRSILEDLRIMAKTPVVMFFKRSGF